MFSNQEQEYIRQRIEMAVRDYLRDHSDEIAKGMATWAVEDLMHSVSEEGCLQDESKNQTVRY